MSLIQLEQLTFFSFLNKEEIIGQRKTSKCSNHIWKLGGKSVVFLDIILWMCEMNNRKLMLWNCIKKLGSVKKWRFCANKTWFNFLVELPLKHLQSQRMGYFTFQMISDCFSIITLIFLSTFQLKVDIEKRCPTIFLRSPQMWRINMSICHIFKTHLKVHNTFRFYVMPLICNTSHGKLASSAISFQALLSCF